MKRLLQLLLCAAPLFGACGSGSTTITGLQLSGATPRQLLVQFVVPNANAVTVDVFTDAACSHEIPDTAAANAANRSGSVVDGVVSGGSTNGAFVLFAAGKLTGSKALLAATQYWVQVSNSGDSSALTLQVSTAAFPTGNLYPEQVAADSTAWDNRTYPRLTLAPANRNTVLTDPMTGLRAKPMTLPGDGFGIGVHTGDGGGTPVFDTPVNNSGSWTNIANLASGYNMALYPTPPTSNYATCSGTCDAWLPLPSTGAIIFGGWDSYAGSSSTTNSVYSDSHGLDYFVPYVAAKMNAGTPPMTVSLTATPTGAAVHGCTFTTAALTTSNTLYYSGADPDIGFASFCTTPPLRGDIAASVGTVNTSGTAVTWASGDYFQSTWGSGQYFKIGSTFYQISTVNSPTSITLTGSAGTQSGAAYASRALGIRIRVTAGANTVSLQAGYGFGYSPMYHVNEDGGQLHCNQNANAVTTDAGGSALGYTLQGYVCWIQYDVFNNGLYYLVIPKDQNGAPLGEVRILGSTTTARTFTSNGATFTNASFYYAGPDVTNPNKWYVISPISSSTSLALLSATFDSGISGCNPLWQTWAGAGSYPANGTNLDSCITYTNLTNPSSNQDVTAAIKAAYSTIDLGGFGLVVGNTTYLDGFFSSCLAPNNSGNFANPNIEVCGIFNTSGALTQVFDSFSTWPARWVFMHGPLHMTGAWHSMTGDFTFASNAAPLAGPFQLTPTKVNLAGFGATPSWTTTTSLDNGTTNQYACPTSAQMQALGTPTAVANALVTMGSSGSHCIELEFNAEPCSATPSSLTVWNGATKTEAQQFPCPTNSSFSMLQASAAGDYIMDGANGQYGEGFIWLTKQITSPGGMCTSGSGNCIIDGWFVRGGGVFPGQISPNYATLQTHANSWVAQMEPLQLIGVAPFAASSSGTHTWLQSYFGLGLTHGAADQGTLASNVNLAYLDLRSLATWDVTNNLAQTSAVFPPWGPGCEQCVSPAYPQYAGGNVGFTNGNLIQIYANGSDFVNPNPRRAMIIRHLNPGNGVGSETATGMGTSGYTLTLVGATNQTYTLTDPYSNGVTNQKLAPLVGWAGAHLLQDYSGVGSILPDTGYGMCRALVASECVSGSSPGTTYVSVPAAAGVTQGIEGQHTQNAPAVVNASSTMCRYEDIALSGTDPGGLRQRTLGDSLTGCGRQWQFNEPKMLPQGDWFMGNVQYKDGFSSQVWLFQNPPAAQDTVNRTGYVKIPVNTGGTSGDSVRVEFWYAEWGGVNGRAEHAFAPGSGSAPFQWAFESAAYAACSSGCTVQVPGISGHLLYYSVHRKNGGETTGATQVIAVP